MVIITPSREDIARFTSATGDDQRLHNAEYMATAGRGGKALEPIVPGLQTLAYSLAATGIARRIYNFEVSFEVPVSAGDEIKIPAHRTDGLVGLAVENAGKFAISLASGADTENKGNLWNVPQAKEGMTDSIDFSEDAAKDITDLFEFGEEEGRFVYALGGASNALLKWTRNNNTLRQAAFGSDDKNLPVYTEVKLYAPEGLGISGATPGALEYKFSVVAAGERDFLVKVDCNTDYSRPVFSSLMAFKSIPERMILRMAKERSNA